jgi:hypothetical protein
MRLRVVFVAVVALVGLSWLGWSVRHARLVSATAPSLVTAAAPELSGGQAARPAPALVPAAPTADAAPALEAAGPPSADAWAARRDEILHSAGTADEKADRLLALVPGLSGADQEEAARHLVNLLSDEHFPVAGGYLTNPQAPDAVQNILMAELLNRPEAVKLPLWLAVARVEEHPRAAEAKEFLALNFPEDYATNWPAWEAAVQTRLQTAP